MKNDQATLREYAFAGAIALLSLSLCGFAFGFSKSDVAAWVQAFGSIGSIWAAIGVVKMQTRNSIRQAEMEIIRNTFATLKAIETEVGTHLETVKNALNAIRLAEATGKISHFPEFTPRFYIYEGAAPTLGHAGNQYFVSEIICAYAELGLFFDVINRRTKCAQRLPAGFQNREFPADSEHADAKIQFTELTKAAKSKGKRLIALHEQLVNRLRETDEAFAGRLAKLFNTGSHRSHLFKKANVN